MALHQLLGSEKQVMRGSGGRTSACGGRSTRCSGACKSRKEAPPRNEAPPRREAPPPEKPQVEGVPDDLTILPKMVVSLVGVPKTFHQAEPSLRGPPLPGQFSITCRLGEHSCPAWGPPTPPASSRSRSQ